MCTEGNADCMSYDRKCDCSCGEMWNILLSCGVISSML
jgi:hypothetical protein